MLRRVKDSHPHVNPASLGLSVLSSLRFLCALCVSALSSNSRLVQAAPQWVLSSSPPPHLLQPLQLRLRLFLHPLLFIRTAHRKILAVLAAAFARGGRERPVNDRPRSEEHT